MWECVCDCGNPNHIIVAGSKLRNGDTKSCGCLQSPDLTGQRFGRLIVLCQDGAYVDKSGRKYKQWSCLCDCGNIKTIIGSSLKRGRTTSCGCFNNELLLERAKKYNDYEIQEDYVIMYTSKGNPFLVDIDDFWKVKGICWHMSTGNYLKGLVNHKEVMLHDYIMDCPRDMIVDHIHGKESRNDNRKSNLRITTKQNNNRNSAVSKNNTSGTTGVHWAKREQKWIARICVDYKTKWLGAFKNKTDAIKARKEAENKYFGEYSYDNSQNI